MKMISYSIIQGVCFIDSFILNAIPLHLKNHLGCFQFFVCFVVAILFYFAIIYNAMSAVLINLSMYKRFSWVRVLEVDLLDLRVCI